MHAELSPSFFITDPWNSKIRCSLFTTPLHGSDGSQGYFVPCRVLSKLIFIRHVAIPSTEATEAKDEICCQNLMSRLFTDAPPRKPRKRVVQRSPPPRKPRKRHCYSSAKPNYQVFSLILFVGELVFVLYARGSAEPLHGSHGSDTVVTVVKPGHDVFLPPPTRKARKR